MSYRLLGIIVGLALPLLLEAQSYTQTMKGSVVDAESARPLPGATVVIMGTDPLLGAAADPDGRFRIEGVPVGRYDIQVSFIGYLPYTAKEIVVGSGREVVLNIGLKESVNELEQVVIHAFSNKNEPVNAMAMVSAKQVSVEEANRYAGGFDDPARLVSSYAGVAAQVGNNGIVIRGNSPKGLLWRMEGIQIPNPNHFADYISLGGGAVTALSSQTMANSDFFTGAFPVEYGNALSGVFDINLRTGNAEKREHVFQAGIVGIDFASEGPFSKEKQSSYLFNYRYSTLGLLAPILPEEMGKLTYQDLSFKLNFPTKAGTFSWWGIGAYDYQGREAVSDSAEWDSDDDRQAFSTRMTLGATGVNHRKIITGKTFVQSTLALTFNTIDWTQENYDETLQLVPEKKVLDYRWKYTFTSFVNHKFSARHTNRTGIILNRLSYDMDIRNAEEGGGPMVTYVTERNASNLLQFYSQSKLNPTDNLTINLGFHSQYFTLNRHFTVEPRLGVRWKFLPAHTLTFAYGLHSQLEAIQLYLVEHESPTEIVMPNKDLDFNKAHHLVLGYEVLFNENLNLKIEPFYQALFDIPVVPGSYFSTINMTELWGFGDSLLNEGSGRNLGIDLTLERYLNRGYYFMFTASLFDSKYTGGDGIERNTRYNRNYVFNLLAGKEWKAGRDRKNLLNANIRFTYMGGQRIIPVDVEATMEKKEIVEDYANAFEHQLHDAQLLSLSLGYRVNKSRYSGVWSFHLINALGNKEFQEYSYNPEEERIETIEDVLIIPNISYKIEF